MHTKLDTEISDKYYILNSFSTAPSSNWFGTKKKTDICTNELESTLINQHHPNEKSHMHQRKNSVKCRCTVYLTECTVEFADVTAIVVMTVKYHFSTEWWDDFDKKDGAHHFEVSIGCNDTDDGIVVQTKLMFLQYTSQWRVAQGRTYRVCLP